jgi:hypothetical protein
MGTEIFHLTVPQLHPSLEIFSTLKADDSGPRWRHRYFFRRKKCSGNYGLPPRSYLLINDHGQWKDVAPPSLANIGMVTDASWTDVDSDGDKDLVVVGDWMAIHIFKNDNGDFQNRSIIPNSNGWWNRIEAADLDMMVTRILS